MKKITPYSPSDFELSTLASFLELNGFEVWKKEMSPCLSIKINDPRLAWYESQTHTMPIVAQRGNASPNSLPFGMFSFNVSGDTIHIFPHQDHTLKDFMMEITKSMCKAKPDVFIEMHCEDILDGMRSSYYNGEAVDRVVELAEEIGGVCFEARSDDQFLVSIIVMTGNPALQWQKSRPDGPIYPADGNGFRIARGPGNTHIIKPLRGQNVDEFLSSVRAAINPDLNNQGGTSPIL